MSKVGRLTSIAALVTMMVISGATAAVVPGAGTFKLKDPVASAPGGDDYVWCDKGTQEVC